MAYARRNDDFGGGSRGARGGKKFGGSSRGRNFSERGGERSALFPAVCAECGERCEVPFKPNGRKPVLCKSCFAQDKEAEPRSFKRRDSGSSFNNDNTADQLRSINAKLDAIMKALSVNGISF